MILPVTNDNDPSPFMFAISYIFCCHTGLKSHKSERMTIHLFGELFLYPAYMSLLKQNPKFSNFNAVEGRVSSTSSTALSSLYLTMCYGNIVICSSGRLPALQACSPDPHHTNTLSHSFTHSFKKKKKKVLIFSHSII